MGKRVLLVEDDASLARSIIDGLSDEGFAVAHAADGDAAREALRAGDWDLVILDWWLPGPDGLEVLKGHRREGGTTPVLFLTARDAVSDRVRGLDGGADDYLCKPFAFDELLARARALTRRGRPVEVMTLSYRDVRVDLAAQKAERTGGTPSATAKSPALPLSVSAHRAHLAAAAAHPFPLRLRNLPRRGRPALPAQGLTAREDARRAPAVGAGGRVGARLDASDSARRAGLRVDERERRVAEVVECFRESHLKRARSQTLS